MLRLTAALFLFTALIHSPKQAASSDLLLSIGDRLTFSVIGVPDIQRDAEIGLDGTLFLPLIGNLPASGMTLREFRASLEQRLRITPIRLPSPDGENVWRGVTPNQIVVEMAAYRPIYVTGAVEAVGEITFRPGLTVRQAVAKAGGRVRFDEEDDTRIVEMISRRDLYRAQIVASEALIARLEADLARLAAEQSGDPDTAPATSAEEAFKLTSEGSRWVEARSSLRDATRASQARQLQQMENRLDVLEELETVGQETVRIEEQNLERVKDLADRGVTTAATLDDARRDLLQSSSRALETAGEVFRLEVDIAQTRERIELQDTEDRVALLDALETELGVLSGLRDRYQVLREYLAVRGAGLGDEPGFETTVVTLYRSGPDGPLERPIALDEQILPGDVLNVEIVTGD